MLGEVVVPALLPRPHWVGADLVEDQILGTKNSKDSRAS